MLGIVCNTVHCAVQTLTGTHTINYRNEKSKAHHSHSVCVSVHVCYKFQRICVVICAETLLNIWMASNILENYIRTTYLYIGMY